jgi:hypothetical protein
MLLNQFSDPRFFDAFSKLALVVFEFLPTVLLPGEPSASESNTERIRGADQ